MYSENDWREFLSHSWGKNPKQKAAEKAYNAKYYQLNKNKWKKYSNNRNKTKVKLHSEGFYEDKAFERLSEKYGVNAYRLKLSDPKVLEIGINEALSNKKSMNVYDKYTKELGEDFLRYGIEYVVDKYKNR